MRRSGSAQFCRWVLYSTRTRKKNRSSIPQDATRLYRLSDFPWLFLPAGVCRLLRYCVTLLAVPGAPGAGLPKWDHGKIGQQGSSAATEARLGSGVNHRGLPGKTVSIGWVRKFALYLRQLVCIQVRGTSVRVPSYGERAKWLTRLAKRQLNRPSPWLCPLAAHKSFAILSRGRARETLRSVQTSTTATSEKYCLPNYTGPLAWRHNRCTVRTRFAHKRKPELCRRIGIDTTGCDVGEDSGTL